MKFNPNVLDCAAAPIAEAWSWVKNPSSPRLIDMCQAVPAHLPPQSLRDYLGDAIKAGEGATYTDIRGIEPLRVELAANISQRYRGETSADDILITAGCNQAFCSVIDTLCETGDEVIVPLPCYFNHQMWLTSRGVVPRYLSFDAQTAMPDPEEARGVRDVLNEAKLFTSVTVVPDPGEKRIWILPRVDERVTLGQLNEALVARFEKARITDAHWAAPCPSCEKHGAMQMTCLTCWQRPGTVAKEDEADGL